ncbi:MAG: anthranilate synthase component I family protein [Bacteroidota bacterium]|uniref:Anthranilate synthase component I family protein n=1 Tax=Flagellimonas profundi TaxID=2915620 RepID=A0ABS3FDA6_9FLAO|nr:anthranilate synthase component I family protein [Allomuricauda profundi]MBO0341129.1 anthranilate synthase component I family protein [Allomuricauda profundi]MEC7771009.1 anthranilate synthase component I family protein [Bacteroidota bacterium]
MRTQRSFKIDSLAQSKKAVFEWSRNHRHAVWLDSNSHVDNYSSFEACLAVGAPKIFKVADELHTFLKEENEWLFGYFSYDFKNELENLSSDNLDSLAFPTIQFFCPNKLIIVADGQLHFKYLETFADEIEVDHNEIIKSKPLEPSNKKETSINIKMRIHKDAYFEKANRFLEHIRRGDIYEANFCQEFYADEVDIDPWETYRKLNGISEPPFAAFGRLEDNYLICASPERYLKKMGEKVISQPIKGTARRGNDELEDEKIKKELSQDQKERSENIMITDLVRNDLSKSALRGSVEVEELCEPYTFKQVHQLISTIVSKVSLDKNPLELIKETFPMGSMTGAPKISAMKIIEEQEETKRGLYSGAVGYFAPNGDFDFNVVIRSILYNAAKKYVSFSVGSAITSKSNPEKEYAECLLKAKAMRTVLEEG